MAITYIGSTDRPGDNSTQGGNVSSPLLIAASGATTGDLVVVISHYRGNATLTLGAESGGQTWNSLTQFNDAANLCAVRVFWCRWDSSLYNGNNPNFSVTSGSSAIAFSTVGHIFRPTTSTNTWDVDNALSSVQYSAPSTPFTVSITGVTPSHASSVAIAGWFSEDDNTWGSLSGTGWSVLGDAQYRNTTGSDMSSSYAYKIQSSSAATGNVSKNQATLGGDAGATFIVSFYEASSGAYTLPITTASYTLTNNAVGLLSGRKLPMTVSSMTLAMNATGLLHGYKVVLSPAAFTLTTISAGLSGTRRVAITPLSLTSTAVSTGLLLGKKLAITTASYSLSGQNIGLSVQRRAAISTVSFTASVQNVGLLATRRLPVSAVAYSLSLIDIGLNYGLRMGITPLNLAITGIAAGLLVNRIAVITTASYNVSTVNASLITARALPVNRLQLSYTSNNVNLNYGSVTNYNLSIATLDLTLIRNNIGLTALRYMPIGQATFATGSNTVSLSIGRRIAIVSLSANALLQAIGLLYARMFGVSVASYALTQKDIAFLIDSINANQVILLQSEIGSAVTAQSAIANNIAEASNITFLIDDNSVIPESQQYNSPIITTN